jgi:26S proteasome regulatory subunit T4
MELCARMFLCFIYSNYVVFRNVCTEAGLFAIRSEREYVIQEDFMKAVRKVADNKKLESKLDYKPV